MDAGRSCSRNQGGWDDVSATKIYAPIQSGASTSVEPAWGEQGLQWRGYHCSMNLPSDGCELPQGEGEAGRVTRALLLAEAGDASAARELLPLVYAQLRAAAQRELANERPGHTLQATALVHEAYLRLVGERRLAWQGRGHFYAAAAEAMRRVLLDHAKSRGRVKRGGGRVVSLDGKDIGEPVAALRFESVAGCTNPDDLLAFDEAFCRLEAEDADSAAVVRLRVYAGLSVDQAAEALGLSARTVDRRWHFARAWLFKELSNGRHTNQGYGGEGGSGNA